MRASPGPSSCRTRRPVPMYCPEASINSSTPLNGTQRTDGAPGHAARVKLENDQLVDVLAALCRRVEIQGRSQRYDTGRIYSAMAHVIVPFDMQKVHCRWDSGQLIDVARIGPEIRVIDDPPNVALEMSMIDRVEANERGEQPYIRLGQCVSEQKASMPEAFLQPIAHLA